MKTILSTIGLIAILLMGYLVGCNGDDYVTKPEFRKAHWYLNKRVDTVIANQNEMKRKIDSIVDAMRRLEARQEYIAYSVDTLKAGQILIYSTVTDYQTNQEVKANWAKKVLNWIQ